MFRRIGSVLSSSVANQLLPIFRSREDIFYYSPPSVTITYATGVSFAAAVPPVSQVAQVAFAGGFGNPASNAYSLYVRPSGYGTAFPVLFGGSNVVSGAASTVTMLLNSSQQIDVQTGSLGGLQVNSPQANVVSFRDPL